MPTVWLFTQTNHQCRHRFENDAFMLRNLVATSMKYVNTHYHYQQVPSPFSTPLNASQRLSTPLNASQRLSTPLNASQRLSTPLNASQRFGSFLLQCILLQCSLLQCSLLQCFLLQCSLLQCSLLHEVSTTT